jgi:hypothetical protein
VSNRLATRSEYANSSPLSPAAASNPMLNVVRPRCPCPASSATTKDESSPPDSSTPTGTSATIRRRTAVRSASSTASRHSSGPRRSGRAARLNSGDQYGVSATRPSAVTTRTVAGGSLRTPRRIVRGAGTTEWNVM